ncbi:MAG: tRNA (N6-threonylcarbamoyladenosine(37)-N6)-methyltransferase TrmO [Bacteroidales bacterium]|nr:tRNA (N6-threonylcarbamoyladenosine(37)-N6)-methyltransferase TrmO [Bacteroidales bacterium]
MIIVPIAHIESEFPQKFGIPRQPSLARNVWSRIVFESDYRNPDCIRGLEVSSHIWLIWEFSEFTGKPWTPLVRPPRLGGNRKMGVFATRAPMRPNSMGLSAVKIEDISIDPKLGPVITVSGADLMNGTPIYDIKPYVPYTDSLPEATTQLFSEPATLSGVRIECALPHPETDRRIVALREILLQDPRPAYKRSGSDMYAFEFSDMHVEFCVVDGVAIVRNLSIIK